MSWWNAKYTNNDGEYEIAFASKEYEKAKAVEKVCCAVMDRAVKSPFDVEVVVRCRECKQGELVFLADNGTTHIECYKCIHPTMGLKIMEPDDFCSYGEKRRDKDGTT